MGHLLGRDASAPVKHFYLQVVARQLGVCEYGRAAGLADGSDHQPDFATFGSILERVGQQIGQHNFQFAGIKVQLHGLGGPGKGVGEAVLPSFHLEEQKYFRQKTNHIARGGLERNLAGFHFSKVEELIHQVQQLVRLLVHQLDIFLLAGKPVGCRQQRLHGPEDEREGRAQLV
jgi:hypothetical protein